ncbi:MAG TPA: molybdopterin-dependent oxidoreductase, partial [Vicinamibacteria bacterium]
MNESASVKGTSCVLDCPDACSLEVVVEEGRVAKIAASDLNDVTRNFICSKVGRFADRLYHPDRLLHPMRRIGAKGEARFERIGWEEALGTITERLRSIRDSVGGEAILPYNYGGSNGFLTDDLVDSAYFARLGASRLDKTICAAPTSGVAKGMYGKMAGVAFPDYPEAKFILIWGANPRASNIHLVPYLRDAKERGAFIALVDPVRTLSTDLVDVHLPVFPGADLPLALGMIHHWQSTGRFDRAFLDTHADGLETLLEAASQWSLDRAAKEARVDRENIRLLADRYAEASPAILRCGWGLERNRNGGQAAAAILAIPALLGKFGRRGSGYTLSNSGAGKLDASKLWDTASWTTRVINMTELAQVLNAPLSPKVHGIFVYNCNPVATVPDQNGILRGLLREDLFTVVFEQVMTDTARYADILLPATTMLEHYDYKRSYGSYVVGATKPVIDPVGEAR